jgi:hypothetical protein
VDPKRIVELVLKRLQRRRVGLLSFVDLTFDPTPSDAPWILISYLAGEAVLAPAPFHRLDALERPETEGNTLSALAVPVCPAPLLRELAGGVYVSPEAYLVAGCLDRRVPVVAGVGHLADRLLPGGPARARFEATLSDLTSSGLFFVGLQPAGATPGPGASAPAPAVSIVPAGGELLLAGRGWVTWRELCTEIGGIRRILLASDTRMTTEAQDGCARLGIRIDRAPS